MKQGIVVGYETIKTLADLGDNESKIFLDQSDSLVLLAYGKVRFQKGSLTIPGENLLKASLRLPLV